MAKKICICGAGTMGNGIAQVSAQSGFSTVLYDLSEEYLAKAKSKIEKDFQNLVDKKKITETEKENDLARLHFTNNINDCKADIVIEAIIEKIEAKENLFGLLSEINSRETIFATNTSSLSVTEIARTIIQPERVIGMHFFNPAPIMKLVEVVTPITRRKIPHELFLNWQDSLAKLLCFVKISRGLSSIMLHDHIISKLCV